jgi:hypothetical protein
VQQTQPTKPCLPYSRRALAVYWIVKAAVELDRRGIRGVFSEYCDLPGTDAAKWSERVRRRWQKSMSVEDLLATIRRELEVLL